jgi:hypothetical protein
MLIEGALPLEYKIYADKLRMYYYNLHGDDANTSKHYWINDVDDIEMRESLEILRNANEIKDAIQEAYPEYNIESVHNSDEIYISVDPSLRKNSDIALSDCHYDAPFKYVPQCKNVFIRVILGLTENSTTYTTIGDKVSVLSTLDFNGMDYNNDYHCVEGYIPTGDIRILLKLHFLCKHKSSSESCANFTKNINDKWTHISREMMRRSVEPTTIMDKCLGYTIVTVRTLYLYSNVLIIFVLIFNMEAVQDNLNEKSL